MPAVGPPTSFATAHPVVVQVKHDTGGIVVVSGGNGVLGGGITIYVVSHNPFLHVTTQAVSAIKSNGPLGVNVTQPLAFGVLIV